MADKRIFDNNETERKYEQPKTASQSIAKSQALSNAEGRQNIKQESRNQQDVQQSDKAPSASSKTATQDSKASGQIITPGHGPAMPKFDPDTAKRLFGYMRRYRSTMVIVVICILLSAIASAVSSMFLQTLIDDYITPLAASDSPVFTGLIHALITVAAIYLVGVVSTWVYNTRMVTIAQGTLKSIRDDMFTRMQKLPVGYFDTHTHGDVMSLYTNDTDTLRQMIAQSMAQFISSLFTVVAVFVCMLYISVWLTVLVCAVLFLALKLVKHLTAKIGRYSIGQQTALAALNGYVEEMVNGQKVVKVFCHEDKSREGLRERNRIWAENATLAGGLATGIMPMMNFVGYLVYIIVAVVGGYMAIAGTGNLGLTGFDTLTLGMIASFLTLSRNFINPISMMSNQMNSVIMALAGASRIFAFIDEEPEQDGGYVTLVNVKEVPADDAAAADLNNTAAFGKAEPTVSSTVSSTGTHTNSSTGSEATSAPSTRLVETSEHTGIWAWKYPHKDGTVELKKLEGYIVFDHVDFGYTPDKTVLHDITLYAKPGQKIALVGATGAGKTTVTNLINRFYDIADGKIRYDGININKIRKEDLRRSLGIVLQDVNLFTGTVMENIRYGNPEATDEQCIAAAKLANADSFIRMLPNGYNTVLKGDGSGLSQGQRQLLSIARAAVSDPPVMILDEATSSIDTRTEALVQDGMDKLMQGRTVFVIAHRLSTVKNSNLIAVMDHGSIIERGDHDDLIAQHGSYYQLYTGAFELE